LIEELDLSQKSCVFSASCAPVTQLRVDATGNGQRIDNFLLARLKGVPRSLVYRILRRGEVRLNRCRVKPSVRLCTGDWLRLPPLRQSVSTELPPPPPALAVRLAAAVLYEDERLLVLDKPAGLAVHGGSGVRHGAIEALRVLRPGTDLELVHRLDRETSGCLLVSKRPSALRWLHEQLRAGAVEKRYLALLAGPLPQPRLRIAAPLRKNQPRGGERIVRVDPAGKPAETWFHRQRAFAARAGCPPLTLVEVEPRTGRTHQIRVHAAHLGAPVAGDDKYGLATTNRSLRAFGLERLFLHAAQLRFLPHPEAAPIDVAAPVPAALAQVLAVLARE